MADRWEVERALAESDLKPMTRLVVYDLLRRSDAATAVIPVRFSPSLASIARGTGLDKSTVKRHLNLAEAGGWVTRARNPKSAGDNAPSDYAMRIPPRRTGSLGAESAQVPGRTERPGVGAENRDPRRTVRPNQTTRPKPDQEHSRGALGPYDSLPGFGEFWAAYPLKKAKRAASKAYRTALNRCGGDPALIAKAAAAYRDDATREARFTKHPATWLNGDCWTDERPADQWDRAMARAQARTEGQP